MKATTQENISEWIDLFIFILESNGFQKREIAQVFNVTIASIYRWCDGGGMRRKSIFIRLCIACVKIKSFDRATICGSDVLRILLNDGRIEYGISPLGDTIEDFVQKWVKKQPKEKRFIRNLLTKSQGDWEDIFRFLRRNKGIIFNPFEKK